MSGIEAGFDLIIDITDIIVGDLKYFWSPTVSPLHEVETQKFLYLTTDCSSRRKTWHWIGPANRRKATRMSFRLGLSKNARDKQSLPIESRRTGVAVADQDYVTPLNDFS